MGPEDQDQTDLEKAQRDRLARDTLVDRDIMSAPRIPKMDAPIYDAPQDDGPTRRALTATAADDAEREGVINRLALLTGQPPAALRALDPARFAELVREQGVLANTQDTPTLRGRYGDNDFARVAGDDVNALAEIERQMLAARKIELQHEAAKPKRDGAGMGALTEYPLGDDLRPGVATPSGVAATGSAIGGALASGTARLSSGIYGIPRAASEINDRFASWVAGRPIESGVSQFFQDRQEAARGYAQEWMPRVDDPTMQAALGGIASLPSSGAGLVLALLSGGSAAPFIGAGFAGGVTAGDEYGTARAQGMDPLSSAAYGLGQGSVETLTEMLPMKWLIGDITAQTPFAKMFLRNLAAEGMTEQVATAGQDFLAWAYLPANADKPFSAYLAERPGAAYETLIATMVASGIQTGVLGAAAEIQKQSQQDTERSEGGLKALDAMVAAAAKSKTRERDAAQFEAYVETLAQDAPIRAAYIKPDTFAAIAASESVSPEQLAMEFGVEGQVAASLASGAAIELPLARFLSVVAGKESTREAYMRGVAWSPFTLSRDEVELQPTKQLAALAADAEKLAQRVAAGEVLPGGPELFAAQVDQIRQSVEKDLRNTGRINLQAAFPMYARLTAAAYGTLALRLGKTPEEVFASEKLRVDSELSGDQFVEQNPSYQGAYDYFKNNPDAANSVSLETLMEVLPGTPRTVLDRARTDFRKAAPAIAAEQALQGEAAKVAEFLKANPDAPQTLRVGEIAKQLGVSPEAVKQARAASQTLYQAGLGFEPIAKSAADDLVTADPATWAKVIKATKYAAYRIPEGRENEPLPKGYVVALHSSGAYALSEKHMREREKAGQATFTRVAQNEQRGAYAPSTNTISLLAKADFSTFLHELGHHWLEVYMRAATDIRNRAKAGEAITAGEQEVLNDMMRWLELAGVDPRLVGTQPGGSTVAQNDTLWALEFLETLDTDATDESAKALHRKLFEAFDKALREKRPMPVPTVRLFRTSTGRIIAFNGAYTHADARMLMPEADAGLRMEHGMYEPWGKGGLADTRWYDQSGTLADKEKYDQLDPKSFKVIKEATPEEREAWYAAEVTEDVSARGRYLRLKSDPLLKHHDIDILIKERNKDGIRGISVDVIFDGRISRPQGVKPTPADAALALKVFTKAALALQVYAAHNRPAFISFVASPSRHEGRARMYDTILRRYDFGYEARITSLIDLVATAGETTAGEAKTFLLVRPDLASEMPLELHNAVIDPDDEWLGEPAVSKRRVITHVVRPGDPNQFRDPRDGGREGDSGGGVPGAYGQGARRKRQNIDPETDRRAKADLGKNEYLAWRYAAEGGSNDDIADRINADRDGDGVLLGPNEVATILVRVRAKGFETEKLRKGPVIGPDALRAILLLSQGVSPTVVAERLGKTRNHINQLKFRHKNLIEQYRAKREGTLAQGPVFYSALKRAAENAKQAKAGAADWKAILRKAEGVKQEEIETVGLFDYLDMLAAQGQKQIVREDIVAFLDAHGVQIEEVLLGPPVEKPKPAAEEDAAFDAFDDARDRVEDDRARYAALVAAHREAIDARAEDALQEVFAEEAEVFIESNATAQRLVQPALDELLREKEDSEREAYFGSGYFDGSMYVEEEEQDDYDGEGDPPTVWVVKNQHYRRARQDAYGVYDTEEEARQAADEMNSEEESEAADLYVSERYGEIQAEARSEMAADLMGFGFYEELFALWLQDVEPSVISETQTDAERDVLYNLGEDALFDAVHPGYTAPTGWRTADPGTGYPPTKWDRFTLVKGDQYRELLLTLASHKGKDFTHSTHWPGRKNMLAHVRFSIVDGVVVIEEIQSDWHQKGREQGYVTPESSAEALHLKKLVEGIEGEKNALANDRDPITNRMKDEPRWHQLARDADAYRADINRLLNGIPDAPMKDSTAWGSLVLKRMVRWAAENGYSEIAWTPGDVQAERRNMFNVVDTLSLYNSGGAPGTYYLVAEKDGQIQFSKDSLTKADVTEHLGKALTEQLFAVEPQEAAAGLARPVRVLNLAENAMVGPGKGMRFFYDTALVNEANRLLKKHGGKVDTRTFPHPGKYRKEGAGGSTEVQTETPYGPSKVPATAYHRMVIPESLKAAALDGLPLFQPEQDGPALTPEERMFFSEASRNMLPPDADALDVWNAMSLNERRQFHELFARQTEAYFFEGKAPATGLRKMFRDFARWLKQTYADIRDLNAPLSDEVRAIMDRVYASSQDIAEANRVNALTPLFTTKPPDMPDQDWQQYQADIADTTMEAEETLRTRSLRDMKWLGNARTRELKRIQAEAKEIRKVVAKQIAQEVMAEKVNAARLFLKSAKNPDGSAIEGVVPYFKDGQLVAGKPKLSISALEAMYPEGSGVDFTTLGYGKWGMLAADGVHPDILAPMLGYESGDALVRDLLTAEPAKEKIEGLTDKAMLERYGDITDDKAAARAADEAVHEGLRSRVLAAEYAALTAMLGQRKLMGEAAKAAAEQLVARMNVSKLSPAKFIAAERRAGRDADAAMRAGKTAEAAIAKRDQLLNFHIVREIHARQAERDRAVAMFYKIVQAKKESIVKVRNYDLVQASRAVLAAVGFAQMRNKPLDYLNAIKAYDPQLYASLEPQLMQVTTSGLKIKDMTVEQFLYLRDTVRQLWDLSREEMLIEINGEKVDKAVVVGDLNTRMEVLGADPAKPILEAPSAWQRRLRSMEGVAASLRRVEQWARLMDGLRVGPFTRFFFRPVNEAATRYRLALSDYLTRYRALFAPIEAKLSQDKIAAPELNGYTFKGKTELLHALLHTGNLSNKAKLLLGYGWAAEDQNGVLDTSRWDAFVQRMVAEGKLTAEDYHFAQGVWDLLEQIKPLAQAAHRRVFGRYFAEVTANPVMTPFGEFRGGYVPVVYDDYHEPSVTEYKRMDAIEANDSQMFPSPGKGFTEARVKYNKPMHLDLRLLSGHIDKVLKFAHMAAPVRDVVRLLRTESVRRNLFDLHPTAVSDMLTPWLMRSARQTTDTPMEGKASSMINRWAAVLRRRANMGLMLGNLVNVMQQPTGILNAMAYKGVRKRHFAPALIRFLSNVRDITDMVHAASPYMQSRALHQAIAMRDAIDDISDPKGAMQKAEQFFARHTYFAQVALQNPQDTVVWLAAYESAKERGDTEPNAALFADGVIRATQGESTPDSISRAETGDALSKILLSMYSYFNMWGNHLSTEFRGAVQEMGLRKSVPRLVYVYSVGFMLPAVLAALIAGAMRGSLPDDEEEDEILLAWLAWFFGTQGSTAAAMVPYAGPAAMAGLNTFNNKPYDDRVLSSPAISALEAAAGSVRNVWDYATGEGDLSNTLKDTFTALTLMTGLPFQALNRPLGYAADVAEGDTEPKDGVDAARAAIAGR